MITTLAEVAAARADGRPLVALESTIITHGMPYPQNVETARRVEAEVRAALKDASDEHLQTTWQRLLVWLWVWKVTSL